MKTFVSLCIKECKSYILSLVSYIFAVIFLIVLGIQAWDQVFLTGQVTARPFFETLPLLFIILLPALTMRLWSEERRVGFDEVLLTSPIKPMGVILAKIVGVLAFIGILLAATSAFPIFLSSAGDLDWGPVIGSYVGALLLSLSIVSIGSFFSMMTKNQIVAFLLTVLTAAVLYTAGLSSVFSVTGVFAEIMHAISIKSHFDQFAKGVIDLTSVVYFLSLSGVMIYFTHQALQRIYYSKK